MSCLKRLLFLLQNVHFLTENLTIHYETSLGQNFSLLDPNRLNTAGGDTGPPPELPKMYCYHCDKVFRQDRALRQHLAKETDLTKICDMYVVRAKKFLCHGLNKPRVSLLKLALEILGSRRMT